jgi:hypothetical protein
MTAADITLVVFTLCNSLRIVAYLPQITRAAKDRTGAQAISFATWALFLLSNVSAVAYALVNKDDWTMAAIFLGNTVGCAAILLVGGWRRSQHCGWLVEWPGCLRAMAPGVSRARHFDEPGNRIEGAGADRR